MTQCRYCKNQATTTIFDMANRARYDCCGRCKEEILALWFDRFHS